MTAPAQNSSDEAADFWEDRYAGSDGIWSGHANASLVDAVSTLEPGTALDLGCGEGGDAIWLAQQGWTVTGIDISTTAIARAEAAALVAGLEPGRVRFLAGDLASPAIHRDGDGDGDGDGGLFALESFALVTACFLHSPVTFPRTEVLRLAAGLVAPGGHLLIVSHAAFPPWAQGHDRHAADFLGPTEELTALNLEGDAWIAIRCETRTRTATGPAGQRAELDDSVVLVRRV